jgi:CheY-like chemotaxis protein
MEGQSRIYVVDDDIITALITKNVLENGLKNNYIIDIYGNGLEAFDGYDRMEIKEDLKLLVTDLNMPKMDGRGLIKKLRESGYVNPIILNTSDVEIVREYMDKPEIIDVNRIIIKGVPKDVAEAAKELLQE